MEKCHFLACIFKCRSDYLHCRVVQLGQDLEEKTVLKEYSKKRTDYRTGVCFSWSVYQSQSCWLINHYNLSCLVVKIFPLKSFVFHSPKFLAWCVHLCPRISHTSSHCTLLPVGTEIIKVRELLKVATTVFSRSLLVSAHVASFAITMGMLSVLASTSKRLILFYGILLEKWSAFTSLFLLFPFFSWTQFSWVFIPITSLELFLRFPLTSDLTVLSQQHFI